MRFCRRKFRKFRFYFVATMFVFLFNFFISVMVKTHEYNQKNAELNEYGLVQIEKTRKCVDLATSRTEMSRRRDVLRKNCPMEKKQPDPRLRLLVSDKHKILFCDIAKIGSTFLKKMWYILENNLTENDPMNLKKNIFSVRFPRLTDFNLSERTKRFNSYTKMIFTRNPYSRLYSAFQNKFVTVNPTYWSKAKAFMKKKRKNPKDLSVRCGHDLTFEEFFSLVSDGPHVKNMDYHWRPLTAYCDPCAIDYDIIGRMESFNEDLQYFLCNINAEDKIDIPHMNPMTLRKFNIKLEISDSVGKIKKIDKKCFSKAELPRRVFQNMVSHGYIEPIGKAHWDDVPNNYTQQDLVNFIYRRMAESTREKLLSLPKSVQDQAFHNISSDVMNKIKDIYREDFKLFEYNLSEY